jgi:hypothetical protein
VEWLLLQSVPNREVKSKPTNPQAQPTAVHRFAQKWHQVVEDRQALKAQQGPTRGSDLLQAREPDHVATVSPEWKSQQASAHRRVVEVDR